MGVRMLWGTGRQGRAADVLCRVGSRVMGERGDQTVEKKGPPEKSERPQIQSNLCSELAKRPPSPSKPIQQHHPRSGFAAQYERPSHAQTTDRKVHKSCEKAMTEHKQA